MPTKTPEERARALVGCRFRPQGRDPAHGLDCIGLVAAAFDIPACEVPNDYRLRGDRTSDLARGIDRWFRRVRSSERRVGDVLLFSMGGEQTHLAILTDLGMVHADAGLRRIVERPGPPPWTVTQVFRRRVRRKRNG